MPRYRVRLDGGALAVMSAVARGRGLACVKTYTAREEGAAFMAYDLLEGAARRL